MNFANFAVKAVLFLSFLALSAAGLKSQDLAARITRMQGSVQFSRPDGNGQLSAVRLGVNDGVFKGDIIKTNSGGSLTLRLADNSQAFISENTIVEIKDITNSPRTIFNVLKGKTRIKIEKLGGRPNPYRVTTPTTVIAVRGTIFDVFVKGDKTEVYVNEGEVSVTSIALSQEVIVRPGNFTRVEGNQPPRPPADFRPQQNDKFFQPKDNSQNVNNPDNKNSKSQDGQNPPDANNPRSPGNAPNNPGGSPNQGGAPPPNKP